MLAGTVLTAGQAPAPAPPPAQGSQGPQGPTFKVQVDYIEVDAFVTDQNGRFVRDLKKEDFQLFEDGKPQTVNAFALVDIPIERGERPLFAAAPLEPDVKTNAQPFEGRIYILLLDELHVLPEHTVRVRQAARRFIQQKLGANDLMAVIHVQAKAEDSQEFTNNKRLLLAAADRFVGKAEQNATLTKYQQYTSSIGIRQPGEAVNDPLEMKRGFDARATLEEMKAVAEWFGGVRGRKKSILLISEGIDYDIYDVFNKRDASMIQDQMRELIRAATKSNVSIYPIDPRGLTDMGDQAIELNGLAAGDDGDPALADIGTRGLANELRLQIDSLRTFAEETGGFAVVNTNGFATAYDRIVEENSSYYVLAYYPPNPKRDGKFHKIDVKVNRPGLTVRARRGYAAPASKSANAPAAKPSTISAEIRDALQSPLPVSGLTLQVFAASFKGVAPNASVMLGVELSGRDLRLNPGDKLQISVHGGRRQRQVQGWQHRNSDAQSASRNEGHCRTDWSSRVDPRANSPGPLSTPCGGQRSGHQCRRFRVVRPGGSRFHQDTASHERAGSDLGRLIPPADDPSRRGAQASVACGSRRKSRLSP